MKSSKIKLSIEMFSPTQITSMKNQLLSLQLLHSIYLCIIFRCNFAICHKNYYLLYYYTTNTSTSSSPYCRNTVKLNSYYHTVHTLEEQLSIKQKPKKLCLSTNQQTHIIYQKPYSVIPFCIATIYSLILCPCPIAALSPKMLYVCILL